MKKLLLTLSAFATVAGIALGVYSYSSSIDPVMLANIAALTQIEEGGGTSSGESDNGQTWQAASKTITITKDQWKYNASAGFWIFKTEVSYSAPAETTVLTFKCCRAKGELKSCPYENCSL